MQGYYFVLTEYESGRKSVSEKKYTSKRTAGRGAAAKRRRAGVKSATIYYQPSMDDVEIKDYI